MTTRSIAPVGAVELEQKRRERNPVPLLRRAGVCVTTKVVDRPHWYCIYVGECPVCGKDQGYRERVYGTKPDLVEDRYSQLPQRACVGCP